MRLHLLKSTTKTGRDFQCRNQQLVIQSRTTLICLHYRIRLVGAISYSCWAILMIGSPPSPLERAKQGLCFELNVRQTVICLSTSLTITVTRVFPLVMNIIGTKAEWRKGKDVFFPSRFKMVANIWIFLTFKVKRFERFSWNFDSFNILIKTYLFKGLFNRW